MVVRTAPISKTENTFGRLVVMLTVHKCVVILSGQLFLAICYCNNTSFTDESIKSNLMYLVAECLAGQAKLSPAHFNRHMVHLLSSTGFGPAHNPGRQTSLLA